jgi:hypothetical protein
MVDTVLCQFHFEFKFPTHMTFRGLKTTYNGLQNFTEKVQACSNGIALFCNLICQIYGEFPLHVFLFSFLNLAQKQRQRSRYID